MREFNQVIIIMAAIILMYENREMKKPVAEPLPQEIVNEKIDDREELERILAEVKAYLVNNVPHEE